MGTSRRLLRRRNGGGPAYNSMVGPGPRAAQSNRQPARPRGYHPPDPLRGLRKDNPAPELTDWPEFDRDIFGGNYTGHHGSGPKVTLTTPPASKNHPILMGVDLTKLKGTGSLYKTTPLAKGTTELIRGTIEGAKPEAIAWTHQPKSGNHIFYTSLGHVNEFTQPSMNVLLKNALCWAAKMPEFRSPNTNKGKQ